MKWWDALEWWVKWGFGILAAGFTTAARFLVRHIRKKKTERLDKMEKEQAEQAKRIEAVEKVQQAMVRAQKAQLYDRLVQAHNYYMKRGWISVADFRNVTYLYEAYHDELGGNSTGTKLYEDMKGLPNREPLGNRREEK